MCGRYNFTVEESDEIREILEKLNKKLKGRKVNTGEIFPTHQVPILIAENDRVEPELSIWGFPQYYKKGVIINARSETAIEKKTFRESVLNRRCIIPTTGFYEWDRTKQKYLFRMEGTNALYMAGLYNYYGDEMRYVILTTAANASMKDVHHRMPLVMPKEDIEAWILDQAASAKMLHREPPQLIRQLNSIVQITVFKKLINKY